MPHNHLPGFVAICFHMQQQGMISQIAGKLDGQFTRVPTNFLSSQSHQTGFNWSILFFISNRNGEGDDRILLGRPSLGIYRSVDDLTWGDLNPRGNGEGVSEDVTLPHAVKQRIPMANRMALRGVLIGVSVFFAQHRARHDCQLLQ